MLPFCTVLMEWTPSLQNNSYPTDAPKAYCATSHRSKAGRSVRPQGMHCEPATLVM